MEAGKDAAAAALAVGVRLVAEDAEAPLPAEAEDNVAQKTRPLWGAGFYFPKLFSGVFCGGNLICLF